MRSFVQKWITKIIYIFDQNKDRDYVSEYDHLLTNFDKQYPSRSASQKKEVKKHRNLFSRKIHCR